MLGTRGFSVNIAPTCSGLEGVGLLLAFLGIYLWVFRRELRFPAALVLLPIGAVSIWLLNALRIVLLIVIGSSGWREIALGGFHSQAGWLTFNFVALGFVALVNRTGWFMKSRQEDRPSPADDSTAAYLAPFVVVLATANGHRCVFIGSRLALPAARGRRRLGPVVFPPALHASRLVVVVAGGSHRHRDVRHLARSRARRCDSA